MPPKPPTLPSRPFRILALPLARLPIPKSTPSQPPSQPSSSPLPEQKPKTPLTLFQITQPDPSPQSGPIPIQEKILNKASEQWLKLGEKKKDSWTYWIYKRGEGIMDRIEFEEWSLKSVVEGRGVRVADKSKGEAQESIQIPLLKPVVGGKELPSMLPKLHRMLLHRIPHHKKMMWRSVILVPFTFPFAVIPVVPNLPMFYVLWRAYSHYKAYRGASYLERLLKLGMITEQSSKDLDNVYASKGIEGGEVQVNHAPDETSSEGVKVGVDGKEGESVKDLAKSGLDLAKLDNASKGQSEEGLDKGTGPAPDGTSTPKSLVYDPSKSTSTSESTPSKPSSKPDGTHQSLLIRPGQIPLLAKTFGLRPNEVIDVTRAVEQAEMRARKIDKENEEGEGKGSKGSSEGSAKA